MQRIFGLQLLLLPFLAQAQLAPDTARQNKLEQVVITGQYSPTDLRQSVNSVRVVNRKTIEQRAALTLEELLQTEPNMRLSQDPILGSALSINGLRGENVKILVDGVPVIGRLNGSVDAGQLPLGAVQQIEMVEGAQSLLYGSDASAGVINLVTRKSQLHRFESEINAQAETNGFRNLEARSGLRMGKFLLQVSGGQLEFSPATDTSLGRDQLWNPKKQQSGRALLRYSASPALDLRLSASFFSEHVENLGDKRRPAYKPYAFDDYYATKRADLNLQGEGKLKKGYFWQAVVGLNHFDRIKNTWRFDFEDSKKSLIEGEQDSSAASGLMTRATIATDKPNKRWNYMLGLENYREGAEGLRILDSTAAKTGVAYGNEMALFASAKTLLWKKITLQGGARWTNNQRYGQAITPSLWLLWRPWANWRFRASYANGFRSPGLKELYFNFIDVNHYIVGNAALNPESAHNFRTEVNWQPIATGTKLVLQFSASGFYNKVADRIILAEFSPAQYRYENLSNWETTGAGAGFSLEFREWLSFRSNAQLTGFYNTYAETETAQRKLNWSPDWVNDLSISFLKQKACFNIWHKHTGKTPYFYEDGGQVKQGESEGWDLLNCSLSARLLKNRVCLNIGAKNLLNTRQIRSQSGDSVHAGGTDTQAVHWGRTWFAGVRLGIW